MGKLRVPLLLPVIGISPLFCDFSLAASVSSLDGSVKYIDTSIPMPIDIDSIKIQEVGNAGFGDGFFTIKIPSKCKNMVTIQ